VLTEQSGVVRVAIIAPDGRIITSSTPGAAGQVMADTGLQTTVSTHNADAEVVSPGEDGSIGPRLTSTRILREYLPVVSDGKV
jgi:hypothetical protein